MKLHCPTLFTSNDVFQINRYIPLKIEFVYIHDDTRLFTTVYTYTYSVIFNKQKRKWIKTNIFKIYINTPNYTIVLEIFTGNMILNPHGWRVDIYTTDYFSYEYLHVLKIMKTKLLTRSERLFLFSFFRGTEIRKYLKKICVRLKM